MHLLLSPKHQRLLHITGWLLFTAAIILYYQKVNLPDKICQRPQGEHIWAQIDRASMALTYHMDHPSFWLPRCHQATNNPEGITAGEFPFIPYTVSKFYDAFGFHEVYHRAFVLACFLMGAVCSFLIARKFIQHWFWSFFTAVIWLASPNIIYYSFSFLPDVVALSCILAATYFLIRNKDRPSAFDLIIFCGIFSFSALIRISSIVPILSIAAAFFLADYRQKLPGLKYKLGFMVACVIPLAVGYAWLSYADWILQHYHIFTFLLEPVPPRSQTELINGLRSFISRIDYFYPKEFFIVMMVATVAGLFRIRQSSRFLLLAAVFSYAGFVAMLFVLFTKGIEHTYYWVPFQVAVFFHVAWLAQLLVQVRIRLWVHVVFGLTVLVLINYHSIHIAKNVEKRWNYRKELYTAYYTLEPQLAALGIGYDQRVITYNDPTYNNTLYLMNRKGWALDQDEGPDHFQRAFNTCQYAILNDTTLLHNPLWAGHFNTLLGRHEGLWIYSLQ